MSIFITLLNKGLSVRKLPKYLSGVLATHSFLIFYFKIRRDFAQAHQARHFSESWALFVIGFDGHVYQTLLIPIAFIIILRDCLLISKVSFTDLKVMLLVPLQVT